MIRVGVIGLGRKGPQLARLVQAIPGVRVTALCDVDPLLLAKRTKSLKLDTPSVFATTDARKLIERPDVDAIIISTSNHWHALLTIWGCQAGKDVYIEKPVSHTVWEGVKMLEAAEKYGCVVQSGTQMRSDIGIKEAVHAVKSGEIGKIKHIRCICYIKRESIGMKAPWYPDWLDYNLWCGPAPMSPLQRNELHYDWHWTWDTGDGDMANTGTHLVDIARQFIGETYAPRRILSLGGRYGHKEAGETPNTQIAVIDYDGTPVVFESRGLTTKPGVDNMDHYKGIRTGVVVQCEGGYYAGYLGGGLYDDKGALIRRIGGDGGQEHLQNFFTAMRNRRVDTLAAPLSDGVAASSACHYANISQRIGAPASFDALKRALADFPVAQDTLNGMAGHLALHNLDINKHPAKLGCWLTPDIKRGTIAGIADADECVTARASHLLKGVQRPPYVIPETTAPV